MARIPCWRSRQRLSLVWLLGAFLIASGPPAAAEERDGSWWDGFPPMGIEGGVYSICEHGEYLYAGGLFDTAGGFPAANVARFNGRRWLAIDNGTNGRVLTVYSYGTTPVIGGNFTEAGGTACAHVADIEESEWTPMGDGLPDWPNAFGVHNTSLHAVGKIDADSDWNYSVLARWDGANWHDVFDGPSLVNEGYALAHFDGSLFLGGNFTFDAPDPDIHNFTEWTGSDLVDLGFFNGEFVRCLQVHDNTLYIGGDFAEFGSTGSWGLAWLSGAREIHPVAQPDVPRLVVDLTVWHDVLLVGQEDAVIPYSGTAWLDTLGGVLDGDLHAVETIGIDLYAAGSFAGSVVRWDTVWDEWVQLGGSPGLTNHERGYINTLSRYGDHVVAAGMFTLPTVLQAQQHCSNIGLWDGEAWHRLGSGCNDEVYALAEYDGDLIAAGRFEYVDGQPVARIARWDGADWYAFGEPNGEVAALELWDGKLVAAGAFSEIGGVSAPRIAAWNGSSWQALAGGLAGTVEALAVHDGELYAGGNFTISGAETLNDVARWDGSQWRALGDGIAGIVRSLVSYDGELIAGGYFVEAGGVVVAHIARWDGEYWRTLGAGVSSASLALGVTALQVASGELYVGGDFTNAGGAAASGVAVWDGVDWREFASGVHDGFWGTYVQSFLVHEGDLYLGGDFTTVGETNVISYNIARWVDGTLVPVFLRAFDLSAETGTVTATWRVTTPIADGAFELTGTAGGFTWPVPVLDTPGGEFRAVDRNPQPGLDRRVTYTLSYRLETGAVEVIARETITVPPPAATRWLGAHPNPFNPGTSIAFELDRPGDVRIDVVDLAGRRVARLAHGRYPAGRHAVAWDGRDESGRPVGAGSYLARLYTEGSTLSCKLMVVR